MADIDSLNQSGSTPQDLQVVAQPDVDKNFFNVKINKLKIDTNYAFQFQWVFKDNTVGAWSSAYNLHTGTELVPVAPTTTITGGAGIITVSLPTFPTNALRVDVRIAGGVFGDGTKVASSFSAAGTKTIVAAGSASPGLAYVVTLLTVTPSKINGTPSSPTTVYVTDPAALIAVDPSVNPSVPSVSSVLGAIQLSWNGKTSTGGNQPAGFDAAKVYVGTSSNFTPVDTGNSGANQVDILNFANGQNTLNISVGTVVNGVALTYNTNYYVKIKTTNGNISQDSSAVSASGSPVQIGKVTSGDIVTVTADQITAGTIESQVVTVGTVSGKHLKLNSSGNPLAIYGTGGINDPILTFGTNSSNQSVLTIKGSGTFSGDISAATGTLTNSLSVGVANGALPGGYPFSVNGSGYLYANSGLIGGWTLTGSQFSSSIVSGSQITLDPATPRISLIGTSGTITIDPVQGIVGPNVTVAGSTGPGFELSPNGTATIRGSIYASSGEFQGVIKSSGTNLGGFAGTLTIDSGNISHPGQIYFNTPFIYANTSSVYLQSGYGYFILGQDGGVILGQGNATGDLQIRLQHADDAGFVRGYLFESLHSGFNDTTGLYTTGSFNTPGRTVTINANNRLSGGRTLYSGNISSAATLDTYLGGAFTGDLYFSTT